MPKRFWFVLCLFVVSFYYLYNTYPQIKLNPFKKDFEFSSPYTVITTKKGNTFVIDSGKQRVFKLNRKNEVEFVIDSGRKPKGGLLRIQNIAADENENLYVHFYVQDLKGFYTTEEYIEKYNRDGTKFGILYSHKFKEPKGLLVLNWTLSNLKYSNGKINWIEYEGEKVTYYSKPANKIKAKPSKTILFSIPQSLSVMASIDVLDKNNYLYATKKGEVYRMRSGNLKKIYDGDDYGTIGGGKKLSELSVPGWVQLSSNGTAYILDVMQTRIYAIDRYENKKEFLSKSTIKESNSYDLTMFFSFRLNENNISFADDTSIIISDLDGKIKSIKNSAIIKSIDKSSFIKKSAKKKIFSINKNAVLKSNSVAHNLVIVLNTFICLILLLALIRYVYIYGMNRKLPAQFMTIVGIIVIMIVTMVIAINVLMPNFDQRYMKEVESKIVNLTRSICNTYNGDAIKSSMMKQANYYDSQYITIRSRLINIFGGYTDDINSEYYFVIYKNYGGELSAYLTENDSFLAYQTWGWLQSEEDNIYLKSMETGEINTEKYLDSTGNWIYAVGPIRDSEGKIVAVIEIGRNFQAFIEENNLIRKQVIIEVITAIILVLMLFVEISLFTHVIKNRKLHQVDNKTSYKRVDLSRFMGFLYEFTFSLPLGFIPIYAIKLLDGKKFHGMTPEMASAFPITLVTFGIVSGTVIAAYVLPRYKWRKVFIVGLAIASIGLFLTGLSGSFLVFTCMQFLSGIGRGLLQMAARAFVNTEENIENRGLAFSNLIAGVVVGINVGVVVGGAIADYLSYRTVFFVASAIVPIVIGFILFGVEKSNKDYEVRVKEESGEKIPLWTFLSKPAVWGYFLLLCVPNAVAYMFLQYTFLIVAENNGFSNTDIGRSFILNGMATFYLGPMLYTYLVKRLGLNGTVFSSVLLWSLSLLIFAFSGSITAALITIFIMGLSDGFGNGATFIFYTDKLREVKQYGVEKALAVNEFMTNVGMAVGPLIFGVAMMLGQRTGMFAIAISMTALALLYFMIYFIGHAKERLSKNGQY